MNDLTFSTTEHALNIQGSLSYAISDHAFRFATADVETSAVANRDTTSLLVGTLQIELRICSSICLFVWGYCPLQRWVQSDLCPPVYKTGSIKVKTRDRFICGISIGVMDEIHATVWFDRSNGWVCIGNCNAAPTGTAVEFATNTIAVVVDEKLYSIWLRPGNWQEIMEAMCGILNV